MKNSRKYIFKMFCVVMVSILSFPVGYPVKIAQSKNLDTSEKKSKCQIKEENSGWFGVGVKSLPENYRQDTPEINTNGIIVTEVVENSPAVNAGIIEGDIIIKIDQEEISTPNNFVSIISKKKINSKINVGLERNGVIQNTTLSIQQKPITLVLYNCGRTNYNNKSFEEAYLDFSKLAQLEYPVGFHMLGLMNENGEGVPENKGEAVRWYSLAAAKGVVDSQFFLAGMYFKGEGIEKDYTKAEELYRALAKNGDRDAQYMMGLINESGYGVPVNIEEAIRWYSLASDSNHMNSKINLGLIYYEGKAVSKKYKKAIEIFEPLAIDGDLFSQSKLYMMFSSEGEDVYDLDKALSWLSSASDQGDIIASKLLGIYYYQGIYFDSNIEKGITLIKPSAENGDADSQEILGYLYSSSAMDNDYEEAIKWYSWSAEQGNAKALCSLAQLYLNGYGVETDFEKAIYFLNTAVNAKDDKANECLGNTYIDIAHKYRNGDSLQRNYRKAEKYFKLAIDIGKLDPQILYILYDIVGYELLTGKMDVSIFEDTFNWYKDIAEKGNSKAQFFLGKMYTDGGVVKSDSQKAVYWFEKSAILGNLESQEYLGSFYHYRDKSIRDYKEAVKWYTMAAAGGSGIAQVALAEMYSLGHGVGKDINIAVGYIKKALEDNPESSVRQGMLGTLLFIQQKYDEAIPWLEKASSENDATAKATLGIILMVGLGVEQNFIRASELMLEASDNGIHQVDPFLALLYLDGIYLEKNVQKGLTLLIDSTERSEGVADGFLGIIYHEGFGVERNLYTARNHYVKSINKGFKFVETHLDKVEKDISIVRYNQQVQSTKPSYQSSSSSSLVQNSGKVLGEILAFTAKAILIGAVVAVGAYADAQIVQSSYQSSNRYGQKYSSAQQNIVSSYRDIGCSSDFSCGVGYRCVKAPLKSSGECMKTVDDLGIRKFSAPSTSSIGVNLDLDGQCRFDTDCPIGFKCHSKFKTCVKR